MNNTLLWVIDSPYSRSIKWLLLNQNVKHMDHIMTWEGMRQDPLLKKYNGKLQVPTWVADHKVINDSLLIALDFLPDDWHTTLDAKLFRLADSDVEAVIIFLFRANFLESEFGEGPQSQFMRDAGINAYKNAVDYLLDELFKERHFCVVGFGLILLYSTLLAASSLAGQGVIAYRLDQLKPIFDQCNRDIFYQKLVNSAEKNGLYDIPFSYLFNKN